MRFRLLRDLVALCFGQAGATLITLVTFGYLSRTLGAERFGSVETAAGLTVFFATLVDLGLGSIGARELAKDRATAPRYAASVPAARLVIAAVAVPAMGLVGHAIADSSAERMLFWLFALGVVGIPWKLDWLFQGLDRMRTVATGTIVRAGAFGLGAYLLVKGPEDLVRVGAVEIVAAFAMGAFFVARQVSRVTPLRLSFSPPELGGLIGQASSIGLSNVVWALHQYIHVLLLKAIIGGDEPGLFGASHRIVHAIVLFSYVYHFNLFPTIVGTAGSPERYDGLMRASIRVVGWFGVVVALVVSLFARPILELAFGEEFGAAAPTFAVLVWAFPLTVMNGHARWSLIANGKQRCVLIAQAAGALVAVPLSPLLISAYGTVGGAVAMVAATLAVWVTAHVQAVRLIRPMPFFPPLGWPLLVALVSAVPLAYAAPDEYALWWKAALVVLAIALTPLGDRAFVPDLLRLAHAKSAPRGPVGPRGEELGS